MTDLFSGEVLHAPGHLVGETGQVPDRGRLVVKRPLVAGGRPTLAQIRAEVTWNGRTRMLRRRDYSR